ncbi:MAG: ATP-binding protein [Chitinivibrionales bacterium]|nr:ATP-binding protein [Chitinivibrionales bacterium]
MNSSLQIEVNPSDSVSGATIMRLMGALDSGSIGALEKSFERLTAENNPYVIVDMNAVSSCSSSALGQLMGGRTMLSEHGGTLVLAGMGFDLKTKLNLLGAHKIFTIYSDLRAALAAYHWHHEHKPEHIECSFPPQIRLTPPVRHFLGRIAKLKGFSDRDAFRIETIVDEVCNNAVEHGSNSADHAVDVAVSIGLQKIEITVTNINNPRNIEYFKSLSHNIFKSPPPSGSDLRGRGLSLVKMLADNVAFDFSDDGTTVHVTKKKREEP